VIPTWYRRSDRGRKQAEILGGIIPFAPPFPQGKELNGNPTVSARVFEDTTRMGSEKGVQQ